MATRKKMREKQQLEEKEDTKEDFICDWAGQPEGVLGEISERLPLIDCLSFANVCKAWRSILTEFPAQQTRGFPWLIMSRQNHKLMRTCVSISENLVWEIGMPEVSWWYCWGSFQDWLIVAKPFSPCFLKLSLFNPFSKTKIDLPDSTEFYHKMVLSTFPPEKTFVCMLLSSLGGDVAFWIPRAQAWHECFIEGGPFEDAVFCNGCFYLLTKDCNIMEIDATGISLAGENYSASSEIKIKFHKMEPLERPRRNRALGYLVESCGEILLVRRFFSTDVCGCRQTENFETYRLDVCKMVWNKLKSLGDRILFLGKGCSRSFPAKELEVGKANCIYFTNDLVAPWSNEWDVASRCQRLRNSHLQGSDESDWGIFSMDDEDNGGFCYRGEPYHWAPLWITAPLWWYCRLNYH